MKAWIGASAVDVIFRLVVQMLSTIVIARVLTPEQFGVGALVLSFVAILGSLLSMPFEEALSQRSYLTTKHLKSALFVSLGLTAVIFVATLAVGPLIAALANAPTLSYLIPVSALFLFGQGPGAVARAILRRRRKFTSLAILQSSSMAIGCAMAVLAAMGGFGVFALILQRMMPLVAYPVLSAIIAWRANSPALLMPVWDKRSFQDLRRVSGFHLFRVGIEYMTPAVMSFMVNGFFGTAALGQLNIAMRMTEPLRSGIASVGHNIIFSQLKRYTGDKLVLGKATTDIIANIASVGVPAFFGLSVCAPILLPLLVGPGWDEAVPIARTLCFAAAISVPFRYLYSGFLAYERPEFSVLCTGLGLIGMVVSLLLVAWIGDPMFVGLGTIAAEMTAATVGTFLLISLGTRSVLPPLRHVAAIWLAAAAMYGVVAYFFLNLDLAGQGIPALLAMMVAGVATYGILLFVLSRPKFRMLLALVK